MSELDSLDEFENIMQSLTRYRADTRWWNRSDSGMLSDNASGMWVQYNAITYLVRELAKARVELDDKDKD